MSIQLFRQRLSKKKRKSIRDNAEGLSGKYPINFNKSSESVLHAISSLRCTVEALWILSFYCNLLSISQATFRHCRVRFYSFLDNLCRNSCIEHGYGYGLPSPLMTSNMNLVSQGPVVRKPINAHPGLKINRGLHLAR